MIGVCVAFLAVLVGSVAFWLGGLAATGDTGVGPPPVGAQETTTTGEPTTTTEEPTTTTEPPTTTTEEPTTTTESPTTTQRSTTSTSSSTSTSSTTSTSSSTTSTTLAPVQIAPPPAPPTEEVDAGGGGGGLSSDAKLAIVVGGLAVIAALIGGLTYLYWRRTRPAPYGSALDALADITLVPAGATAATSTAATTAIPAVGPLGPFPAPPDDSVPGDTGLLNPSQGPPTPPIVGEAEGNGGLFFPPRPDDDNAAFDLGDKPLFPPRTGEQPPVLPEPPPPIVTLEDLQAEGPQESPPSEGLGHEGFQDGPRQEEDGPDG